MVEQMVKLSSKSQIVIPKVFREHFGIPSQGIVIMQDTDKGILITKQTKDPLEILKETAKKISEKRKGKPIKVNPHDIYTQFEERKKRAGL
jgi:bifunctional DNA-binding transcriptional regulator/antitoxin component of YhaV-PrlF toxin-antitoxin module